MRLSRCNGDGKHFYDSDKYLSCPHCAESEESVEIKETSSIQQSREMFHTEGSEYSKLSSHENVLKSYEEHTGSVTTPLRSSISPIKTNHIYDADGLESIFVEDTTTSINDDDSSVNRNTRETEELIDTESHTMRFASTTSKRIIYSTSSIFDPVVGWLVCIAGESRGQDFRMRAGRNFIGRNEDMDICLKGDSTVSRQRHAIIVYDPKSNSFLAQPGDSHQLFYVNNELVTMPIEIHKDDIIQVGSFDLLFVPLCNDYFEWNA